MLEGLTQSWHPMFTGNIQTFDRDTVDIVFKTQNPIYSISEAFI